MSEVNSPGGDQQPGLRIRPLEEVIPLVKGNAEKLRSEFGIPTRAEIEDSDPKVPTLMCDPFIKADDFLARTERAEAIIVVAFATGAMPDRLVPAIQQRIQQGIPVFVLSDNPGNNHGILRVIYDAGSGAYKAGAIGLQKINVNQYRELKAIILEALGKGLKGKDLEREIEQRYAYQQGEKKPLAQWEDPNYVDPPRKTMRQILRDSGFIDDDGEYTPPT